VLAEFTMAPVKPVAELDEQLDWAPVLDDEVASAPLMVESATPLPAVLGPLFETVAETKWLELVEAPELVEQLPELPLTLHRL